MNKNWIGLLVFLALPAMAQVYKCKDSNGKQVYSDIPCGSDAAPLQVKPSRGTQPAEMDPNIARQMQDLRDREREEAREDCGEVIDLTLPVSREKPRETQCGGGC